MRIAQVNLDQVNRQIDRLDIAQNEIAELRRRLDNIGNQVIIADPFHAPSTTNNLVFTWTGGAATLTWPQGYIKDKNWNAQIVGTPAFSSAPGIPHIFGVPAGTLTLSPSTYYWLAWDPDHQQMRATGDASTLHGDKDVHIICQIYTGTAGQTGVAGGGGSTGGVDLSGTRYKNF